MNKKKIITMGVIAIAVVAWFVAAHFFGPNSERSIAKEVSRLQQDSIALQGDFRPKGQYSYLQDMVADIQELKDLGRPLRFGSSETDSIRLFRNPHTATIAKYNIAKCDSVFAEVSPVWRASAAMVLSRTLKEKEPNTIVRLNKAYSNYTGLEIYSMRYISKDNLEKDASKYNRYLGQLGFKSAIYSVSPDNEGFEFTFDATSD